MKIGILSDIHVDINYSNGKDIITPAICVYILKNHLDIFIIAGDIASDYALSLHVVETIEKDTGIPCLFVPGNHDIWTEHHPGMTSRDIYHELQKHPHNLAASPFNLNDKWIVIGDIGWYDYRFGSTIYTTKDFDRMQYDERVWQDSIQAKWNRSTMEMHKFFLNKLENQLAAAGDKKIILVTHVLPIKEFTVQNPPPMWNYLNAFLGSPEYGELVEKHPGIKYSISGHVHYRKKIKKANTIFINSCLGYRTEWQNNTDPLSEVQKAATIIEI